MNEALLSFIWSHRTFELNKLCTTDGESLQIESPGSLNHDSGPDFSHARIRFSDALLVGNVELHVRSSDWLKHGHQEDANYDNIILHVVYERDTELDLPCPELVLKPYINDGLLDRYRQLNEQLNEIPCSDQLHEMDGLTRVQWLDRWLVERLEQKTESLQSILRGHAGDWNKLLIQVLFQSMGFVVNKVPFEVLARLFNRHSTYLLYQNQASIEAFLFGQAGFLEQESEAEYLKSLRAHYRYLRHKLDLKPMPISLWKFHRMRPHNSPCRRLSQLAGLLTDFQSLRSIVVTNPDIQILKPLVMKEAHPYWADHLRPGHSCRNLGLNMGDDSAERVIQNALLPYAFLYAMNNQDNSLKSQVLETYHALPPERNKIISKWLSRGVRIEQAADSQALVHGYKLHCLKKDCLNCVWGKRLLQKQNSTKFVKGFV